ncbi:cytosine-purine permease [Sistotremastrum niveocremeum HHB9708]|uniref:Cytosine-purine permease n=1 Tax=Sistotremastrum niveocremeum HHB9708 TaxID=1314777 RepID=A0A164YX05_9AGAM|nr:cytosine-purine permease [Sistotremastrum niveocremeum HHB9708]
MKSGFPSHERDSFDDDDVKAAPDKVIAQRFGVLGPYLAKLFDHGVEARGVERCPEDQREDQHFWNNLLMWWSVNACLTTVPIGILAQTLFTLTFPHAVACILTFGVIGAALCSFIATLGPQTGLRSLMISRFSVGHIGGTIFSGLNILTQLGFATSAVILGGQTLAAINPGTLPLAWGCVIIAVGSLVPCFVGYNMVHYYEKYAWVIAYFIFIVLYALGGKAGYDIGAQKALENRGTDYVASVLSFGSIVYGSFGWGAVVADYNCKLPVNTSPHKVFWMTFLGLYIPICFAEILGAALITITAPAYVAAYGDGNAGQLLAQVLSPWKGGGKFLLTLLALTNVANNIPQTYSAAISIQALGRPLALIPRFFWCLVAFALYTTAAIVGREHFSLILSNVLSVLGYWTSIFVIMILEEHVLFRRPSGRLRGYNLDDYDSPTKLPLGLAGILAGCIGAAGAVLGMSQVYYTGPIARTIGSSGADIGWELALSFTGVSFPLLRTLEIRFTGR